MKTLLKHSKKTLPKSSPVKAVASSKADSEGLVAFFSKARAVAKKLDARESFGGERVLLMDKPEDVVKALSKQRMAIVRSLAREPLSVGHLVEQLHRERSAVMRDVKVLESYGVVDVTKVPNAGHGSRLEVRRVADRIAVELAF